MIRSLAGIVPAAAMVAMIGTSAPAHADVTNAMGYGSDRAEACTIAKSHAAAQTRGGDLKGYSGCDCSDSGVEGINRWTCSVDAYYSRR
jgi:hypothetical protein